MADTCAFVRHTARRLASAATLALTIVLVSGGAATAADRVVYGDGLEGGWSNWSWSSSVSFNAGGGTGGGQAISWRPVTAWGGLYLHIDSGVPTSDSSALKFALLASHDNQRLTVSVYGAGYAPIGMQRPLADLGGNPPANQWRWYHIPLSNLGAAGHAITGIVLQDATGAPQATFRVDDVMLTSVGGGAPTSVSSDCLGVPAYPEIRWENHGRNSTRGRPTEGWRFYGDQNWRWYYDRIDGNCTGTTEQILEWAARKWGFDQLGYPDLAKAMGVVETWWRQDLRGPLGEVGILQVHPTYWPDWEPAVWSTAYAADYAMAVVRAHYDGASWLGGQTRGNLRDAVAAWNCGCPYYGWGPYAMALFHFYDVKPWLRPGQPPEWF
jgi:hypothetical protein